MAGSKPTVAVVCLCVEYLSLLVTSAVADWEYRPGSDQGPSHWTKEYSLCGETQQSPVNIDTTSIWHSSSLHAFDLPGYESIPHSAHWEMHNTGRNVFFTRPIGCVAEYLLPSYTLDGRHFPMEIQLVHYKREYRTLEQAYMHESGVCIMAFLVELGDSENVPFNQITNNLQNITYQGEHLVLRPVPLFSLLPLNLNLYYRYQGSINQPPCYKSVVWSVFKNHIKISPKQLKSFRTKLSTQPRDSPYEPMINNFRSVQPIGARHVYSSDPADASILTAPLESPVSVTLAVFLGLVVMLFLLRGGDIE